MRWLIVLACLLLPVAATAQVTHARGEFAFAIEAEPGFVQRVEVPLEWDPAAPGHDEPRWRYWWHDAQTDRRGAADHQYAEHVFEPRATSVLGEAGRFQVSFNPDYQTLAFHRVELRRDGRWVDRLVPERISLARRERGFEQDLADGLVSALVVLDDVRVGDVVRVSYSIKGSNPVLAGQVSDWSQLGWRNPVLGNRLRVLYDPGTEPAVHREHTDAEAVVTRRDDGVEVVVASAAMAAVLDEGDYPAWHQPFPQVQVAPARSWADVVAWALPLYPPPPPLPADLEARLREWARIRSPLERLTAVARAVQDEVRYFGVEMGENTHRPSAPGVTWERRFGDCKDKSYLLVTLLRRLDIHAEPALASVGRGRAVAGFVPSASDFDHVIVRVRLGREVRWVDPTQTYRGGAAGDADLSGYGMVLPLVAGSAAMVEIAAPAVGPGGVHVTERYAPAADAAHVTLEVATVYSGDAADGARRGAATERREERGRRYADYYRKRFGELDAVSLPVILDDRDRNRITVTETYLLRDALQAEGAARAMDTYADSLDSPSRLPSVMQRHGPLAASQRGRYRHDIEFHMPEGWSARFGQERDVQAVEGFAYSREVDVLDGVAALRYQLDVAGRDVEPGEVRTHVGSLRKVRDGLSARLRFQPPAAQASAERRRRLEALLKDTMKKDGQ
ncbi:DUF3857 domain-containing protein [Luteimonas sp. MC1572]|uniref:DUF3857 domain-containing protein n=1 Tax=Luteimonas sp. MC1572 TaxID=2799325 RepID=UPI0018F07D29|nr:DUF3857 domain-containing protein [Luteimonas sp. MC1572]MBJ6982399.1 DUF3857 domain-containing protein [Luteimonas sp. MC1572]QQO03660.1 DUF3857 domain-containing protein [Luteimonas sp. MC1572]